MNDIYLRIAITFLLSLIFGIQRQFSNKPIGFGTFIFVAIGSCGLAISAINLNYENPLPLLSAIVTGIGFLGAGALIKTSDKIFGFTSAASIWLFAIIGLTVGIGLYVIAFSLYILVWIVVWIDRYFEVKGLGLYQKKITIVLNKPYSKTEIKALLNAKKYKTLSIEFDKSKKIYSFTLIVENSRNNMEKLPALMTSHEDIVEFSIN
ncbi:MAG: MgtC/SapB family protein [Spirochaetales bacterium]|nr:MgtC/SapB family protein [Spirochaetales bacterium]